MSLKGDQLLRQVQKEIKKNTKLSIANDFSIQALSDYKSF